MFSYRAYGLTVASEFELPEAIPAESQADVRVRRGPLSASIPAGFDDGCFAATPTEAYLYWSDVGTIAVRDGCEVIVDPLPDADERVIRLVILGAALAVVLHQRGFAVLHAGVVGLNGGAVAFVGGSGWGKSTMVAAMHDRGAKLVTDDIAAIEMLGTEAPVVHPGFPQIKLFPDSISRFGGDPEAMPILDPAADKRGRRLEDAFVQDVLPLKRIYVLARRDEDEIVDLAPSEALVELVRHTFPVVSRVVELTGAAAAQFPQCVRLVDQVPVCRLAREPGMARISEVARLVEQHAASGDTTDGGEC